MTADEFKDKFMDEDNEVDLPLTDLVDRGDEVVDHKHVYQSDVYEHNGQFFEVTYIRSNSGYWGDSEREDPIVSEVFPYTFTETRYK